MLKRTLAVLSLSLVPSLALADRPAPPGVPAVPGERVTQRGPGGPPGGPGKRSPADREARRAELEQKVDTYITVELASQIGLSNDKALKLADALKARRASRKTRREATMAEYQKLKELVDKGAPEKDIKAQTARTVEAGRAMRDEDDVLDDTAKFLTPMEQAKLVLAFPHVRREMKQLMKDGRGRRGERGERGARGPGGFDDED